MTHLRKEVRLEKPFFLNYLCVCVCGCVRLLLLIIQLLSELKMATCVTASSNSQVTFIKKKTISSDLVMTGSWEKKKSNQIIQSHSQCLVIWPKIVQIVSLTIKHYAPAIYIIYLWLPDGLDFNCVNGWSFVKLAGIVCLATASFTSFTHPLVTANVLRTDCSH